MSGDYIGRTLTPDEERAQACLRYIADSGFIDWEETEKNIVAAFRAIREECAKVAEEYAEGCRNADERIAMDHCMAIADAIRHGTPGEGGTEQQRSCNIHNNCDVADHDARVKGRSFAKHCYIEDCEDCFGK